MFPLIGGIFGLVIGAVSSSNPNVAIICGAFFALVAWALSGFRLGSGDDRKQQLNHPQAAIKAEESPRVVADPPQIPNRFEPAQKSVSGDAQQERGWRNFKIKALLLVATVGIVANYEKCTESDAQRLRKNIQASETLKSISAEEAFNDCMEEGLKSSECRDSAERAKDLAAKKSRSIYGP
jgi:hypothetical protein